MKRETIEQKAVRVKQERNNKIFVASAMGASALMFLGLGTYVNMFFIPFFPVFIFLAIYHSVNASIQNMRIKTFIKNGMDSEE